MMLKGSNKQGRLMTGDCHPLVSCRSRGGGESLCLSKPKPKPTALAEEGSAKPHSHILGGCYIFLSFSSNPHPPNHPLVYNPHPHHSPTCTQRSPISPSLRCRRSIPSEPGGQRGRRAAGSGSTPPGHPPPLGSARFGRRAARSPELLRFGPTALRALNSFPTGCFVPFGSLFYRYVFFGAPSLLGDAGMQHPLDPN